MVDAAVERFGTVDILINNAGAAIGGDRVPLVDSRSGRRFGDTLDESQLVRLPGAGHLPQVEQPADFVRALRRFVDRRR